MADVEIPKVFEEAYEIVKTLDLWGPGNPGAHFRVEVVRALRGGPAGGEYQVHYTVEENGVWKSFDGGWVTRDDPDSALRQALGFLAQHAEKESK